MAGITYGICEGYGVDCTVDCDSRNITLSASIIPCIVYYLWIQDCEKMGCSFNISISGDKGPPQLPSPLPPIEAVDEPICIGKSVELFTGRGLCDIRLDWFVDGEFKEHDYALRYEFNQDREYEVCYTVKLETVTAVCAEGTHCQMIRPTIEKEIGALMRPCRKKEPFNWHGLEVVQNCINPPCTVRTESFEGCIVDSIRQIMYAPIPVRLGPVLNIDQANVPYDWHGLQITSNCISPPCTARLEGPDGCLFDSIRPFRILMYPLGHGFLKGNVYNDLNNNCQKDQGELSLENIQIEISGSQNSFQTLTNRNGFYSLVVPFDDYQIRARDLTDSLFACPVPAQITIDRQDSTYCQDFHKFPSNCYAGRINILPLQGLERMRCDRRRRQLQIEFYNTDKDALAAEKVILTVDRHMELLDATLPFTQVNAGEIILDVPELQSGEKITADITFRGDCMIQNENDEVCFVARYENAYVCNGEELQSEFCDIIVNSRDPNDLTIVPYGKTYQRLIEREWLTGLIRFHNEGSAFALDIQVELNLRFDQLNMETFELLGSSADDIDMVVLSNQVRFDMPDINLPHDAHDSVGSHGYIKYRVKVEEEVEDWEEIEQQADIYFDLNAAVPTNTETQMIAGDYIRNNIEATACVGDTFKGVLILGDTIFSDTLIGSGPDEINKYYVVSHPSYYVHIDTQMLAGYRLHGVRITKDTVIDFEYKTRLGCDSIITYEVDSRTTKTRDWEESVVLYPNPVRGKQLYISGENSKIDKIDFIHMSGGIQVSLKVAEDRVNIEDLKSGVYMYRIHHADGGTTIGSIMVH